jgi:hypothetical protein
MGAKTDRVREVRSQFEGDTSTFLERRHMQKRLYVGVYCVRMGVEWIAAGDW